MIKECHYISNVNQVELEKCAKELVRYAYNSGWYIVIVSNQSGISRNKLTWDDYIKITKKMISLFGKPNPFSAIYANSQGPTSKKNNWRKPNPDMILRAVEVLNIDLKKSIIIGDRLTDLMSGLNAGINTLVHTETGHGKEDSNIVSENLCLKQLPNKSKLIKIKNLCEFPVKHISKIKLNF